MAAFLTPFLSAGIQGLAGMFGARPERTTTSSTQNTNTNVNYTPEQQQMLEMLRRQYMSQIQGADLSGYQTQGLNEINRAGDASQTAIRNILAQRGLAFSPAAATSQVQQRVGQAGQQSQFLNSIPLLQFQMRQQALQGASGFANSERVGTSSTTTSNGTQTGPGNMLGGLFAGIGSGIASTLGRRFANSGSGSSSGSSSRYNGVS